MELTRDKVEIFMVALFLIKNHGYKFITVHQKEDELWMGNPKNEEFPVIRISSGKTDSVFFDSQRILEIHHAALRAFRCDAKLLDLHISDETETFDDSKFVQTILNHGNIYGKDIRYCFPLIQSSITSFSDPKEEYARLNRELEDYQAQLIQSKKKMEKNKIKMTYVIMAICLVVFALDYLCYYAFSSSNYSIYSICLALGGYFRNCIVIHHQYWRLLTGAFHHLDLWHIVMNLLSLKSIGPILEEAYGKKKFLGIFLFSVLVGNLFVYVLTDATLVVGISGGLYGCMAAWLVYAYTHGLFRIPSFRKSVIRILLINLFLNLLPNVSFEGHLGGFIGGLLISLALVDYKPWQQMKKHALIASMLITVVLALKVITIQPQDLPLYYDHMEMIELYDEIGLDKYADKLYEDLIEYYER